MPSYLGCSATPTGTALARPVQTSSSNNRCIPHRIRYLQEVAVLAEDGASARFLWRMGIGAQVRFRCRMLAGVGALHCFCRSWRIN